MRTSRKSGLRFPDGAASGDSDGGAAHRGLRECGAGAGQVRFFDHLRARAPPRGRAGCGSRPDADCVAREVDSTATRQPPDRASDDHEGTCKGAPTDAQVRAAVAQFKRAIATYHLDKLNLSGVLLNQSQLPAGPYRVSIASVYTDYGLPIACGGVLHVPQLGVANKTLPCGTEVTFIYNGRAIRVPVIDRGPYIAGREWDLTGATAEALHFPGLGPIYWRLG